MHDFNALLRIAVVTTCIMMMNTVTGQTHRRPGHKAPRWTNPPQVAMPAHGLPPEEQAFWDAQPKNGQPRFDNSADIPPPRERETMRPEEPTGRGLTGVHLPPSPPPPPGGEEGMGPPPDGDTEWSRGDGNWNVPQEQHHYNP